MLVYKIREFGKKYEDASTSDDTLFKQILFSANPNSFDDKHDRFILPEIPKLDSEEEIDIISTQITEKHIGNKNLKSFFENKKKIKEKLRVRDIFIDELKYSIRQENKNYGICSFTKNWNQLKNWIEYGNSNNGFAIGFETDDLIKLDLFSYAADVVYSNEYPQIPLLDYFPSDSSNPLDWFTNVFSKTFFIKSIDWKHENEWRIVKSFVDNPFSIERKFKFPAGIIKEIVLGFETNSKNTEKVVSFFSGSSIPIYKTYLPEDSYELKRIKIN